MMVMAGLFGETTFSLFFFGQRPTPILFDQRCVTDKISMHFERAATTAPNGGVKTPARENSYFVKTPVFCGMSAGGWPHVQMSPESTQKCVKSILFVFM